MPLIVTGTVGIDTVHTPHARAEKVLGGSCTYFAAAASFFTQVRVVAVVGGDFHEDYHAVFRRFPNVDVSGLELRKDSRTFAWGGRYLDDMNQRETLFTELGVLGEHPPKPPRKFADSKFVFLANSHPVVQRELLESFPQRTIAVADTMNLWIETARRDLDDLLGKIDGLVVNDEEARMLTGKRNPVAAGRKILETGPIFVVIKKGEHGCVLVHRQGVALLPAFPTERVVDPTGAGDSFAGGMMGHLAAAHSKDADIGMGAIQQALAHGTVTASFTIEAFSLDRLATLTRDEIARRYTEFQTMVRV
ncbi:MAG TPA: sugar kinase [Phycisphaerales bacterium]|nr:sugar kinase [Phycisphaerales bacterium]